MTSKLGVQPGDEVIDGHAAIYKVNTVDEHGGFIAGRKNYEFMFNADGTRKDVEHPLTSVTLHRLRESIPPQETNQEDNNSIRFPSPKVSAIAVVTNPT